MTTPRPTQTLTEFLLARIAEDEAVARAYPERFWYDAIKVEEDDPLREFLDRFDAARVLAECEAKRRIIGEHGANDSQVDPCYPRDINPEMIPCPTLRLLALLYADHPHYDEAWRP